MLKLFVKKWSILLLIILSSFIIGIRTYMEVFHFLFWLLIAIVATSLIWVLIEYLGVRLYLTRKAASKISEDDCLQLEAIVENSSFLPAFNIALEDNLACAEVNKRKQLLLIEYLGPGRSVRLEYKCSCPLRGKYRLGPFAVYFFDPLGLFFLKRVYYIYSQLYVYPSTFNINKLPDLSRGILPWFGIETARVSGDEDELFGAREYQEGDPIKRIHWVSTARKNRLIVKQFQRQSFFRATILFNLEKDKNFGFGKDKVAEYITKVAASLAKYLLSKDVSLELIAHTEEMVHIQFNKGPEHFEDILKFLAVAQAESGVTLGEIFEYYSRYIPDDSTLIIIMLDKDWQYLPKILQLTKRSISVVPVVLISSTFLYFFDKQEVFKDIKIKISQAYNFKPILISCHDNLEEAFLRY